MLCTVCHSRGHRASHCPKAPLVDRPEEPAAQPVVSPEVGTVDQIDPNYGFYCGLQQHAEGPPRHE